MQKIIRAEKRLIELSGNISKNHVAAIKESIAAQILNKIFFGKWSLYQYIKSKNEKQTLENINSGSFVKLPRNEIIFSYA